MISNGRNHLIWEISNKLEKSKNHSLYWVTKNPSNLDMYLVTELKNPNHTQACTLVWENGRVGYWNPILKPLSNKQ